MSPLESNRITPMSSTTSSHRVERGGHGDGEKHIPCFRIRMQEQEIDPHDRYNRQCQIRIDSLFLDQVVLQCTADMNMVVSEAAYTVMLADTEASRLRMNVLADAENQYCWLRRVWRRLRRREARTCNTPQVLDTVGPLVCRAVGKAVGELAEVLRYTKVGLITKREAGYNVVSLEGGFGAMEEHVMTRCQAEEAKAISTLIELLELSRGHRAMEVKAKTQRAVKSCQELFDMIINVKELNHFVYEKSTEESVSQSADGTFQGNVSESASATLAAAAMRQQQSQHVVQQESLHAADKVGMLTTCARSPLTSPCASVPSQSSPNEASSSHVELTRLCSCLRVTKR